MFKGENNKGNVKFQSSANQQLIFLLICSAASLPRKRGIRREKSVGI